jgi:hypothetical protein
MRTTEQLQEEAAMNRMLEREPLDILLRARKYLRLLNDYAGSGLLTGVMINHFGELLEMRGDWCA